MFANLDGLMIVYLLITLVFSIGLHEAMHAFTSNWLGDTTAAELGRISLNPLKHIDLFTTIMLPLLLITAGLPPFFAAKPVPFNPARVRWEEFGAALVGLAGPLTNLVLAVMAAGLFRLFPGGNLHDFFLLFLEVNVALFVFNMIPFPPLDGSRVLYAVAPEPLQEIMARIESLGFVAIIIFMLLFFSLLGSTIGNIDVWLINLLIGNPLI